MCGGTVTYTNAVLTVDTWQLQWCAAPPVPTSFCCKSVESPLVSWHGKASDIGIRGEEPKLQCLRREMGAEVCQGGGPGESPTRHWGAAGKNKCLVVIYGRISS